LPEPDGAVSIFRHVLSYPPPSASASLALASVYEAEGHVPAARDAFLQAQRVYPLSAAVSWPYGNFLLRQGEIAPAFAEIRRAAYADPKRSAEAFSRCWRIDPNVNALLDTIIPPDRDAYLAIMRELSSANEVAAALAVWQRLVSLHPLIHPGEVIFFADLLIQRHQISEARRVWDEAVRLSQVVTGDLPGSVIWDGSFESGVSGGAFAWALPAASNGVQAAFDCGQKHSGKQSLRLFFDGRHNPNYDGVCDYAEVQPETTYRFSAWVHTQALTSDEGVRFRIHWQSEGGGRGSADSQDARGTQSWTPMEMSWTPGKNVHQARVCVQRNMSRGIAPRIQGTAWIDDVALVPVGTPKP
jgi:hypothetical protein